MDKVVYFNSLYTWGSPNSNSAQFYFDMAKTDSGAYCKMSLQRLDVKESFGTTKEMPPKGHACKIRIH